MPMEELRRLIEGLNARRLPSLSYLADPEVRCRRARLLRAPRELAPARPPGRGGPAADPGRRRRRHPAGAAGERSSAHPQSRDRPADWILARLEPSHRGCAGRNRFRRPGRYADPRRGDARRRRDQPRSRGLAAPGRGRPAERPPGAIQPVAAGRGQIGETLTREETAAASLGQQPERQLEGGVSLSVPLYSEQAWAGLRLGAVVAGRPGGRAGPGAARRGARCRGRVPGRAAGQYRLPTFVGPTSTAPVSNLEVARLREGVGSTSRADIYRWQGEVANARRDLISAEAQVRVASLELKPGFSTGRWTGRWRSNRSR